MFECTDCLGFAPTVIKIAMRTKYRLFRTPFEFQTSYPNICDRVVMKIRAKKQKGIVAFPKLNRRYSIMIISPLVNVKVFAAMQKIR